MKILVEDSGAGFEIWKLINENVFGRYFDVIAHHGNRDLLFDIEKNGELYNKELCILVVDKMVDDILTAETYYKIKKVVDKYENLYLVQYGCLERELLTYKELPKIVGDTKTAAYKNIQYVLSHSNKFGVIDKANIKDQKYKNKNSEKLYKAVFSEYTSKTEAFISGDYVGICWKLRCCRTREFNKSTKCSFNDIVGKSLVVKINHIVDSSEFTDVKLEILKCMQEYSDKRYESNVFDSTYKSKIVAKYNPIELLCLKCKCIEKYKAWSYTFIHNIG